MDLTEILVIATAIGVLVAALTDVIKTAFEVPERFLPLMSLMLGIALGLAASTIHEATFAQLAWGGGIAGLIASGALDKAKQMMNKDDDK